MRFPESRSLASQSWSNISFIIEANEAYAVWGCWNSSVMVFGSIFILLLCFQSYSTSCQKLFVHSIYNKWRWNEAHISNVKIHSTVYANTFGKRPPWWIHINSWVQGIPISFIRVQDIGFTKGHFKAKSIFLFLQQTICAIVLKRCTHLFCIAF